MQQIKTHIKAQVERCSETKSLNFTRRQSSEMPSLNVRFSLPAAYKIKKHRKRNGVPSFQWTSYATRVSEAHTNVIRYRPEGKNWRLWLETNQHKIVYMLSDALDVTTPRYIGETGDPLKRCWQHVQEAVLHNHPSHKNEWIRERNVSATQILLTPLLVVPHKKRLLYEKAIRHTFQQLGYPIFNTARNPKASYRLFEEDTISIQYISTQMLSILDNKSDYKSRACDLFLEHIVN